MLVLVATGMLYTYIAVFLGMDSTIEIGFTIGAFLFGALFFLLWFNARKLALVKKYT
jgi:hypothetical protein